MSYRCECVCICCLKGHLEVPQILTRRSQSALGFETASWAAENGHLHILEYLVERKYDKYDEMRVSWRPENGHLDCLKYLHETAKAPWDYCAVREAHENNQPECLQYLLDNDCPLPPGWRTRMESYTWQNQNKICNNTHACAHTQRNNQTKLHQLLSTTRT